MRYPRWGSRRVVNWLRRREELVINRKRVQQIMREEGLLLKPSRKKASRGEGRRKPVARRLHQWWGIDMTKFLVESIGWFYLVAVVDWYSRKVVGYALDVHCRSDLWIQALEEAVLNEFPDGSECLAFSKHLLPTTIPKGTPIPKGGSIPSRRIVSGLMNGKI